MKKSKQRICRRETGTFEGREREREKTKNYNNNNTFYKAQM